MDIIIGTADVGLRVDILKGVKRTGEGSMGKEYVLAKHWN